MDSQRANRWGGGLPASFDGVIVIAMPIYEYECAACRKVSSHVVMGSRRPSRLSCPACGGARLKRVMSSFAVVSSEASRLAEFDTSRPRDESFYRDSRNVGLWAKKRAKEMGADLGSKFEETVEKARSGKLVKEML
jgi:putative FmdB family regulatory protein